MSKQNRANRLASWILANSDKINTLESVQIVFDCAGGSARVEVKERQTIKTAELTLVQAQRRPV